MTWLTIISYIIEFKESKNTYYNKMNVGFFVRQFFERGTEVATYDYAKYNEELLNNKSYIICFTPDAQLTHNLSPERYSYDKFKERFEIIEIENISEMKYVILLHNIDFFHALMYGGPNDIYQFDNKFIWGNCKTIKHCVFETTSPESDYHISISYTINQKYNTTIPIIPHIVDLPDCQENLRNELNIPHDAIVYGRYGGIDEFNIDFMYEAIVEHINSNLDNSYFLFMNTKQFCNYHPRVIFIDRNIDLLYKVKFINTCDAMIHARTSGETFGLSIGEFSVKNKPIITCDCGDNEHIKILGDKALLYNSKEDVLNIFKNIRTIIASRSDWVSDYKLCSPTYIMSLFDTFIFKKHLTI